MIMFILHPHVWTYSNFQAEEEREKLKERRKKDREKLLSKKRNLDGLVKDAQKKNAEYERKVSIYFPLYHVKLKVIQLQILKEVIVSHFYFRALG